MKGGCSYCGMRGKLTKGDHQAIGGEEHKGRVEALLVQRTCKRQGPSKACSEGSLVEED
jgi:hypothetical protein